jgi:hypothetical protein
MGRSDGREGSGAAMAMAAQRWRWRRSDSFGSAATAMAMAAQRWGWQWWQRRRMSIALLSLRVAAHLLLPMDALLSSPTDVRDVFCIFLLSLHIFNVGIPYTQTDGWTDTNRRQFNHFFYRLVKLSLTRSIRVTINCFINYTRNNKLS